VGQHAARGKHRSGVATMPRPKRPAPRQLNCSTICPATRSRAKRRVGGKKAPWGAGQHRCGQRDGGSGTAKRDRALPMRPPARRLLLLRLDHADESTRPARGARSGIVTTFPGERPSDLADRGGGRENCTSAGALVSDTRACAQNTRTKNIPGLRAFKRVSSHFGRLNEQLQRP
jgi:hypothetical protein